jgi:hypothetical protein
MEASRQKVEAKPAASAAVVSLPRRKDDRFRGAPKYDPVGHHARSGSGVRDRGSCGLRKLDIASAVGVMGLPRFDVAFPVRQCDKENHGWREGLAATVPC